jgi:capsular exopolysaccharide synthesis family protein
VIVVDADLRRPSIAQYLGLEGSVGLTTVLIGRATLDQVIQRYGPTSLHVLPAGQVPPNPSEVLGSAAMGDVLAKLTETYDIVLLDSPPLLPVTDAAVLSRQTGGTLVIAGAGKIRRQQLADALESIQSIDAHVLGVVINRMPTKSRNSYGYSYYGTYQPRPARRGPPTSPRLWLLHRVRRSFPRSSAHRFSGSCRRPSRLRMCP